MNSLLIFTLLLQATISIICIEVLLDIYSVENVRNNKSVTYEQSIEKYRCKVIHEPTQCPIVP